MSNIIIMQKNLENGFFENELTQINLENHEDLIETIFVFTKDDENLVNLRLTTDKEVSDWEYTAIFDYYDDEIFAGEINEIKEYSDSYNPAWEIIFPYIEDEIEGKIINILEKHYNEILDIYETIADKESDYED